MKLLSIFVILSASGTSFADGYSLYADKIYELERQGHINHEDAQERVFELSLRDNKKSLAMRNAARGVASAISQRKVIKITNEPIEVSLSKN